MASPEEKRAILARKNAYLREKRQSKAKPTKKCTNCGETKPIEQFAPHNESADGYTSHCKLCRAEYSNDAKKRRYRAETEAKK